MKRTPGPWNLTDWKDGTFSIASASKTNGIADVSIWNEPYSSMVIMEEGDWHVVASAPEMFDLLKAYVANDPCAPNDPRFIAAKAIIAKAEGKCQEEK